MPYTLISSVGTGMYKDGYRQTTYTFPDGKTFETRLFLEAILKCKYREIDSVILVGTQTSSWDALVDNSIDNDLWEQVFSATNQGEGIDGANPLIHRLEEYLSNRFANIKFIIKIHTDKVDFDTAESIFKTYNSLVPTIKKENHVLFDITHGFRSMPILLYQALQYSFTQSESLQNVELVYGEYNINTRISIVRNLSDYWFYSQVADAVLIFKNKLDGSRLSTLLKGKYTSLAKKISYFTEIVQTNSSLQFENFLSQLNNINLSQIKGPFWLNDVVDFLKEIAKLKAKSRARTLYNLSGFFLNKKLNVQAVITLQLAVETAFAEKYGDSDSVGNYDWWSDFKKMKDGIEQSSKRDRVIDGFPFSPDERKSLCRQLALLEHGRNSIAHGGAKNKGAKGFPQPSNIPGVYERGKKGVVTLLELLKL